MVRLIQRKSRRGHFAPSQLALVLSTSHHVIDPRKTPPMKSLSVGPPLTFKFKPAPAKMPMNERIVAGFESVRSKVEVYAIHQAAGEFLKERAVGVCAGAEAALLRAIETPRKTRNAAPMSWIVA